MEQIIQRVFAMQKVIQFTKADEATHTVAGIVTTSAPDKEGESCNYKAAKKAYEAWSAEFQKSTSNAGQSESLGNIRVQHGDAVGGKVTALEFNDADESIYISSVPIDDEMWNQIADGFYTGFSQGGDYAWRICQECGETVPKTKGNYCGKCKKVVGIEYGPVISEVSYVDNPCHGQAHFDLVKTDGTHQMVKFKRSNMDEQQKGQGQSSEVSADIQTRIDEAVKTAVASALAKEADKKKEEETKQKKSAHFKELIKSFLEVKIAERLPSTLNKDMYGVARFAGLINELAYLAYSTQYEAEIEQDGSELPDALQEDLENLVETFLAMAEEEANELTEELSERIGKVMKVTPTGLDKAYSKAAGTINKIKKAVSDHHEAIHKANEEHEEKIHGHLDDLKDCMMGEAKKSTEPASVKKVKSNEDEVEEHDGGNMEECDPQEEGTENIAQKSKKPAAVEKSYTVAEVEALVNDAVNKAVQGVVGALMKADDEEEEEEKPEPKPAKKAAAAPGIGKRESAGPVIGGGPVLKVVPTSKEEDGLPTMVKATGTDGDVSQADVSAALQKGDTAAQLKLMKSAVPQRSVPATLHQAVGSLGRGRR